MASKKKIDAPPVVRRYEIHLVSLDPTAGRETRKTRPCVVVSPNAMHVTATSLHPQWAHRLQITCDSKPAEIMADQIRAVSLERFVRRIDTLKPADAEALRHLIVRLYATT
ncbi:MAG: type II toxin-antitoxin system PemK/MazF family toxin [Akkermansiaceae bacterium]|nr:type II toxin-antitoxin system PemK/MazF family toxin [Akkermansiaceae bacterium]